MGIDLGNLAEPGARQGDEVQPDTQIRLGHNAAVILHQKVVVFQQRAVGGVLDGYHPVVHQPLFDVSKTRW
jgi:hypothetical protein